MPDASITIAIFAFIAFAIPIVVALWKIFSVRELLSSNIKDNRHRIELLEQHITHLHDQQDLAINGIKEVVQHVRDRSTRTEEKLGSRITKPPNSQRTSARALSYSEQQAVLEVLHSERFVDQSPAEVYATLLDEGTYLYSIRTMYRILAEHQEVKERRNQLRRPDYRKPELLATGVNQLWSWDITKLQSLEKWTYFGGRGSGLCSISQI